MKLEFSVEICIDNKPITVAEGTADMEYDRTDGTYYCLQMDLDSLNTDDKPISIHRRVIDPGRATLRHVMFYEIEEAILAKYLRDLEDMRHVA